MHSTFTPALAREIVRDRLRDADGRRRARVARDGRRTASSTAPTRPV